MRGEVAYRRSCFILRSGTWISGISAVACLDHGPRRTLALCCGRYLFPQAIGKPARSSHGCAPSLSPPYCQGPGTGRPTPWRRESCDRCCGSGCWSTTAKRLRTASSRSGTIIARPYCLIGCWRSMSKWILREGLVTDETIFSAVTSCFQIRKPAIWATLIRCYATTFNRLTSRRRCFSQTVVSWRISSMPTNAMDGAPQSPPHIRTIRKRIEGSGGVARSSGGSVHWRSVVVLDLIVIAKGLRGGALLSRECHG